MLSLPLSLLFLLLLSVEVYGSNIEIPVPDETLPTRSLRAAVLYSEVEKRDPREIILHHDMELHYVEETFSYSYDTVYGRVKLGSQTPTLLLEEIEHMVATVECKTGTIEISVGTDEHYERMKAVLRSVPRYHIVTSHFGCNDYGSRTPFLATHTIFFEADRVFRVTVERLKWREAYHSISVDFGQRDCEDYQILDHMHPREQHSFSLFPRATSTLTPSLPPAPSSSVVVASTSVAFPSIDPAQPTTTGSPSANIDYHFLNEQILPFNSSLTDELGDTLPEGLVLLCKNCTIVGNVELTDVPLTATLVPTPGIDGSASFTANGLFAHIELEVKWPSSASRTFTTKLIELGLPTLSIPGIAIIGPIFKLILTYGATYSAALSGDDLEFSYGFEIAVPDDSYAEVDFTDLTSSSLSGFQETIFTAIPFQSTAQNLTLTINASLTSNFLIGISVLDDSFFAGAGAFVQVPTISETMQMVNSTDTNCQPSTNATIVESIEKYFGNLLHLQSELEIGAGFVAEANVEKDNVIDVYTELATSFVGPTACLAYDKHSSSYTAAAAALASASNAAPGVRARIDLLAGQCLLIGLAMILGMSFLL